jgi:hypothetical protein
MLISESVVSKLLEIERAITAIVSSGLSTKRFNKYLNESVIESLFYTGKTFFPKMTRLDAKRLSKGKDMTEYQILINYRKTLEYIRYQAEFSPLTSQVANHINKLLCENIVENWQPRNFSTTKNKFDNTYDFTTIRPEECDSIDNIIMLLQKTDLSILRAAEVFQYTVKYKPFLSLNDITALALLTYECIRFYSKPSFLVSFPKVILSEDDIDGIIDSNKILDILVKGIYSEISDLKDRILKHSYQEKVDKNSEYANLSERQLAVLRYLQNNPTINRRQYMKLFKVSTMTAFRDLSDLVEKNIIDVKGVGRGTFYSLVKS